MRFLMLDRVLDFKTDRSLVAIKNVSMDADYLQHHFPESPVFPGVLITESMAQAAGYLMMRSAELNNEPPIVCIMTGNKCRYLQAVRPGDQIRTEVTLVDRSANLGIAKAISKVDGELVCRAELNFLIHQIDTEKWAAQQTQWRTTVRNAERQGNLL